MNAIDVVADVGAGLRRGDGTRQLPVIGAVYWRVVPEDLSDFTAMHHAHGGVALVDCCVFGCLWLCQSFLRRW